AGLKSVHPVTGKPSTAALGKPLQSVNGSYTATIRKGQWWLSGPSVWNGWFVNPNSGSPTPHDAHFEDHVGFAQKAVYYGHMEAMVRGTTNAVCLDSGSSEFYGSIGWSVSIDSTGVTGVSFAAGN